MTELNRILKQLDVLQKEKQAILAQYAKADATEKRAIEQRMQESVAKYQALYQEIKALAAQQ